MHAIIEKFDCGAEALTGRASVQLIAMKSSADERRRFQDTDLCMFWLRTDKERYRELRMHALRILVMFGSTYLCETSFSTMAGLKTKVRSCLTDEHLEDNLRVALSTYEPNYAKLMQGMQAQPSH